MKGNARMTAEREQPVQREAGGWQAPDGRHPGSKRNMTCLRMEKIVVSRTLKHLGGGGGISNWYIDY